jgi:hypothetical protein
MQMIDARHHHAVTHDRVAAAERMQLLDRRWR